ncbi:MAG TPA: uroporphyrinogen decarboxylase family protein [Candidatus Ventrousia excrementavium]|uniref:Uroporphyrinogen decarboxylase family protein n=1 Tax=Candidatus Ventrousia excrementavium TaxID=2840961 RepID=A0A9D1IUM0_9CLOT|nr:uroporphyrinogen decarboxylase family protein [Candidatus Ventrousia excrementavium]
MDYQTLKREMENYPDTMTNAERMKAYAMGQEVDRIPFTLGNAYSLVRLYGYTPGQYRRSLDIQFELAEKVRAEFCGSGMAANTNLSLRGVGEALGSKAVYPENDTDYLTDFVLKDYSMLDELVFDPETNPYLQEKMQRARDIRERMGGKCMVVTGGAGPMTTAISIRQPELFLRDMIRDKKNAHRLLDFAVQCTLKWVEYNCNEFGTIPVGLADPATSANLISDRMFREFSKPHMADLLAGIKKITGSVPGIHICGRTKHIWNDLAELGFPSFSVDNCEDLAELKQTVGDKMKISGNVPPTTVLRNGTIDDVIESVKQCLIKGSDSPCGYSLAVGCEVPLGTPRENLEAYIYAARRYGRGAQKGKPCRGLIEEHLV